jgi:hypothetical protein
MHPAPLAAAPLAWYIILAIAVATLMGLAALYLLLAPRRPRGLPPLPPGQLWERGVTKGTWRQVVSRKEQLQREIQMLEMVAANAVSPQALPFSFEEPAYQSFARPSSPAWGSGSRGVEPEWLVRPESQHGALPSLAQPGPGAGYGWNGSPAPW